MQGYVWGRPAGGGSTGLDAVARARIDQITVQAGDIVPPQGSLMGLGYVWTNGTTADITVPATLDVASLTAAGLTQGIAAGAAPVETVATYAALPDPGVRKVGDRAVVTADPDDRLNGLHVAMGADPSKPAAYWQAAT